MRALKRPEGRAPHTLEAGISTKQADEMRRQALTLVEPAGLHASYTGAQRAGLFSVAEFVEFVRRKQTP